MEAVKKEVIFDETGTYKYSLLCKWSEVNERKLTFILSFPENTYEYSDDTAVSKCIELAQKWGFGVLEIVYLFSYQTDHVSFLRMLSKEEAVGTRAGEYIQKAVEDAELVVVARGDHGAFITAERKRTLFETQAGILFWKNEAAISSPYFIRRAPHRITKIRNAG